jgi:general nucleoside transport system permease protein
MAEAKPKTRVSWGQVARRLLPLFAVITAILFGVPFIIITAGRGDIPRGLNIAGVAYASLLEGSLGIAANDLVSPDDFNLVRQLAQNDPLTRQELRALSADLQDLENAGIPEVQRYTETLAALQSSGLDAQALNTLGVNLPQIRLIGADTLLRIEPLMNDLDALPRSEQRTLLNTYSGAVNLSAEDRAVLEAALPSAAELDDAQLLQSLRLIDVNGSAVLRAALEQLAVLEANNIDPVSPQANDIVAMAQLTNRTVTGVERVQQLQQVEARIAAAGIADLLALASQLRTVNSLYGEDYLTNDDVLIALDTELPPLLEQNTVINRPGNRILVNAGQMGAFGSILNNHNTPDDPTDDRAEAIYLRLGGSALLFFPGQLEDTIVRAIPFIIGGLAIALGFKAGLFNIGGEGQLYMGALAAVLVGVNLQGLPLVLHLPLTLIAGVIGGGLWGAVPGILKAYTGAHEVIVTIMLNFITINVVDWLIKEVLRDPGTSTDQTQSVLPSARLPTFDDFSSLIYIVAGFVVALIGLALLRETIRKNPRAALRPVLWGVLTAVGGIVLSALAVQGKLHFGVIVMVLAVVFTDWFLTRTTLGFELRTVGSNPDAARYAGMSVPFNIVLAMAMSGALAGIAGAIQITGVEMNLKPGAFGGAGFDAIAVALLARTNPRNMIAAGFLWGALYSGAGIMQARAGISIDLVKIIQALIIMFIAADTIIRVLWRVPQASKDEKSAATFSKGWGG